MIPDSITVNSSSISDLNQIAEEFNNHFANVGKSLANSLKDSNTNDESIYLKHPCPTSIFLQPTTPLEIMVLINSLKLNKAKSHDDIDPYFLKIAAPILAFPLSVFLNHCLTFGTFPNRLKLAKVVPVFKKGLTDQLSNYRPISLLPSLSKLFERIIHSRLLSFFEYNNTIVTTQYGFRHNRSTIHPILDLITSCFDNINNKKYSTLLFLDIKKAFDSVSHKKLIRKLEHYGIRGVANDLIKSYLEKRKQFVSIANFNSSDLVIEYGVPQGSILGPLLFLIYINDLPSCLQSLPRFFADDTALLITGKTLKDIQFQANLELSNVLQWMNANSLILNAAKSEALVVSPYVRKSEPPVTFEIGKDFFQSSISAKYLGVTIDNHLSFNQHITLLENKIARSVGVISKLRFYLPQSSLVILYFSLVHTHLLYALPVWASTYNTYLSKLKRLQNKAVRIISRTSIKDRITPNYHRLEILKLDDLYTLEIAKLMYQFTQNKLPDTFDHYFTYSSDVSKHYTRHVTQEDHIFLNRFATSRTQHTIKYIGVKIWNNIPKEIKKLSYTKFILSYKKFLLSKYNLK